MPGEAGEISPWAKGWAYEVGARTEVRGENDKHHSCVICAQQLGFSSVPQPGMG